MSSCTITTAEKVNEKRKDTGKRKILMTHKNSKHGIKYMLKFSDNTQELATESEAMIDCKDLWLEYKNKVLHKKRKTRKK